MEDIPAFKTSFVLKRTPWGCLQLQINDRNTNSISRLVFPKRAKWHKTSPNTEPWWQGAMRGVRADQKIDNVKLRHLAKWCGISSLKKRECRVIGTLHVAPPEGIMVPHDIDALLLESHWSCSLSQLPQIVLRIINPKRHFFFKWKCDNRWMTEHVASAYSVYPRILLHLGQTILRSLPSAGQPPQIAMNGSPQLMRESWWGVKFRKRIVYLGILRQWPSYAQLGSSHGW